MRIPEAAFAISMAGYVAAKGMQYGHGSAAMASKRAQAAEAMQNLNMFNLKASVGSMVSGLFMKNIYGNCEGVNNLINSITIKEIQQIEGTYFGAPFSFIFYDISSSQYIGDLSGYFTYEGYIEFDQDSHIPPDGKLPKSISDGGGGGSLWSVTIKADGRVSADIAKHGEISNEQLRKILGDEFGMKPFKIILVNDNGAEIGCISGSFNKAGIVIDHKNTHIPKSPKPSPTAATTTSTIQADADMSANIIENGKISDDQLKALLGNLFGMEPFMIILVDGSGKQIGYISGSFSNGAIIIDINNTKIPPAAQPSAIASSPPEADGSSANQGAVTLSGSSDQIQSQLSNLSYDYIKSAVGGKYGPFYISFSSANGSLKGYINGTFYANSYTYNWSYTYTN